MPMYLRTDGSVYNMAQRSYQQFVTHVTGKHRASKDVMALASLGTAGTPSFAQHTSSGPRDLADTLVEPPGSSNTEFQMTVAAIPSGGQDGQGQAVVAYPRREASAGPLVCYKCLTSGHRVPDRDSSQKRNVSS